MILLVCSQNTFLWNVLEILFQTENSLHFTSLTSQAEAHVKERNEEDKKARIL